MILFFILCHFHLDLIITSAEDFSLNRPLTSPQIPNAENKKGKQVFSFLMFCIILIQIKFYVFLGTENSEGRKQYDNINISDRSFKVLDEHNCADQQTSKLSFV